jgi:hypothetical protein
VSATHIIAGTLVGLMIAGVSLIVLGWRTANRDSMAGGEIGVMFGIIAFHHLARNQTVGIFTDILHNIFGNPPAPMDVNVILTERAKNNSQKLDWQHSIVDLLKLLGFDSGLANRQALARELGYTGPLDGSAAMNMWLHQAVMRKFRESGGHIPPGFSP